MADIILFTPNKDELTPEPRPEEFVGEAVDWIQPVTEEEQEDFIEQNAIHLFWIGINQLLLNGYPDVPHLLTLIAEEVKWQQEHGAPKT